VTAHYEHDRFFIRHAGKILATPLFLVLIAVETTDLIFAVDSIPAVFAVTADPFIVYTSNAFAILGLRALYFVFAKAVGQFYYLRFALSVILVFVGVKMLLSDIFPISIGLSLAFIATVLVIGMIASFWRARRLQQATQASLPQTSK
jgi:tellurite resistance protein TerC